MKKNVLLLLLLPFLFTACSSDDDEKVGGDIVGKWMFKSITPNKVNLGSKELNIIFTEVIKTITAASIEEEIGIKPFAELTLNNEILNEDGIAIGEYMAVSETGKLTMMEYEDRSTIAGKYYASSRALTVTVDISDFLEEQIEEETGERPNIVAVVNINFEKN